MAAAQRATALSLDGDVATRGDGGDDRGRSRRARDGDGRAAWAGNRDHGAGELRAERAIGFDADIRARVDGVRGRSVVVVRTVLRLGCRRGCHHGCRNSHDTAGVC